MRTTVADAKPHPNYELSKTQRTHHRFQLGDDPELMALLRTSVNSAKQLWVNTSAAGGAKI